MTSSRAKEIFLDALDRHAAEQARFVEESCGLDESLRAEVEEMLRVHRDSTLLLNRPAIELRGDFLEGAPIAPPKSEQLGETIDRYRLVRSLGEGGFGHVFLAEQTFPVKRQVALKVIRRGMDTDHVIARFGLERQALAMMDHPGIARVLDAGATELGRPYFVMEFVDGQPITQFARERQLDIAQRLELIEQACLAVQHAHQKGIIHRDLKPGNILVTTVDEKPLVKVIDFGVAKAVDTESHSPAMTLESQIIGTPQYMSPEQATTGTTQIDTRSDVYSLGTVLYELVTGAPPFDPEPLRHAGLENLCRIIREQTPTKPSTRIAGLRQTSELGLETRALRRKLAKEIDWIVMKAIEKEPSRRYQSPAELAQDIRRHLTDRPVLASPPSRFYLVRKFARRHRPALAATAAIALTLVAMTITSAILAARARTAEADARRQAARAEEELARANAIVGFTGDMLGGIAPAVARGRDTALLRDLLQRSIEKADSGLEPKSRIGLAVRNIIGRALDDLGDSSAALTELQKIYDDTADGPHRDDPERIRAGIAIANIHIMQFDAQRAAPVVQELHESIRRAGLENSELAQDVKIAHAGVMMRGPRPPDAEPILREVLDYYQKSGKAESNPAVRAGNNLASVLSTQGRFEESTELWLQMYEIERRLYGDDHPSTLMTMIDLGVTFQRQKRVAEAEKWMSDALVKGRKIFEPGHPTMLMNMCNLATLLIYQSRFSDAEAILVEGLESGRAKMAISESPLDVVAMQLGRARALQGRYAEALQVSSELCEALVAKNGLRHRRTVSLLPNVLEDYAGAGRSAEGLELVRELGEFPDDTDADIRQRLEASIGKLYLAAGDELEARRRAQLAREAAPPGPDGRFPLVLRELEAALKITPTTSSGS